MGRGLRVLKAFKADWFRPLNPIILRPFRRSIQADEETRYCKIHDEVA